MLGTCTLCLARSASLREAADVLRTDRRTRGEEERSPVHGQRCGLQPLMQYVTARQQAASPPSYIHAPARHTPPRSLNPVTTPQTQKKHRKMRPGSFQNASQSLPNALKIDPGASFDRQEAPKSTKEAPKTGPRAAQERPRAAQERPSGAQETLGRDHDHPKSKPRPEKVDVDKPDVFSIDFGRVRTSFWKGFSY